MWDHFFPLLSPKDSESLKFLDIWLWEVGAKRLFNGTSKGNKHRDTHTNRQVHIWTNQLIESIGPEGRRFENNICCASCVKDQVSGVTLYMLLTPTATATDPPPSNSHTMQRKMLLVILPWSIKYELQRPISELKSLNLRPMTCLNFSLQNIFAVDRLDFLNWYMGIKRCSLKRKN